MATEKLIVELDARTKKLDAKLLATNKRFDALEGKVKKTDSTLALMSKTMSKAKAPIVAVATASLAVGAAVSAMILASAKGRVELDLMAKQAKTTAKDFQALSFATSKYGIDAGKIADISKDISDKVGEFARDATGPFQDFANQMRLSKVEAKKLAVSFQDLSSEQVIGKMVSMMEAANTPADQMTQVLESMGNDLSRLQPLFAKNSKELSILKKRFDDVNKSLQITDQQADDLKKVSETYGLMTTQIGNAATSISATLAPAMDEFFNGVIEVVPQATQVIIDFINSFRSADELNSIKNIDEQIKSSIETMAKLEGAAVRVTEARKKGQGLLNVVTTQGERRAEREFWEEAERLIALKARRAELEGIIEAQKIADAEALAGGKISASGGVATGTGTDSGIGDVDQIKAIADRFKTESVLLEEKLELDLEIIGENNELKMQLQEAYLTKILEMEQDANEAIADSNAAAMAKEKKTKDALVKSQKKLDDEEIKSKIKVGSAIVNAAMGSTAQLFQLVKDAAASQIEAYGLTAGARALAELGPIAGPPVAASYIGWSQVAAGVVKALPLGGGGGGSAPGSSSGQAAQQQQQPQQQSFVQETSSQETSVNVVGDEASTDNTSITFNTDGGSASDEFLASMLNDNAKRGAINIGRTR